MIDLLQNILAMPAAQVVLRMVAYGLAGWAGVLLKTQTTDAQKDAVYAILAALVAGIVDHYGQGVTKARLQQQPAPQQGEKTENAQ